MAQSELSHCPQSMALLPGVSTAAFGLYLVPGPEPGTAENVRPPTRLTPPRVAGLRQPLDIARLLEQPDQLHRLRRLAHPRRATMTAELYAHAAPSRRIVRWNRSNSASSAACSAACRAALASNSAAS